MKDHAQRYSDTRTNPPYNSKGAVHADRIDKTIISNNNFTTSSGASILSDGVTNSKIQGNIFNRWGVGAVAPVACIVLDSSANTVSKSYGNEIDGNTFYNSLKVGGYLLESGTFDTNNFWGNGNRIRLESQATLTALFNTPNFKLSQSVSFRRNLIAGENIGDANQDTFSISGLYNITNDTIAASIIGLPIGAAVAGTLKVEVANLYATRYYMPFRSTGNGNTYIQKISKNI
ncbi:MAG: NosD domain-containing protein, partial [Sphingobacterium sp.]